MTHRLFAILIALLLAPTAVYAGQYTSEFDRQPDRVWLGPNLWANPMEDWQVHGGRLECTTSAPDRNVQLLTQQLNGRDGAFTASVRLGLIEGSRGAAGLTVGIHDEINDYRGNLFFGHGIRAWITTAGELVLDGRIVKLADRSDLKNVTLRLDGKPDGGQYALKLVATDTASGKLLGEAAARVPADWVIGNIALAHNPPAKKGKPNARFWFKDWSVSGDKIDDHPNQCFGPILFAMHTLNDTRTAEGHVMKITAQMPPLGDADSQEVRLEADYGEGFKKLSTQKIDPDSRTATFRVAHWPADRDVPYRLLYALKSTDDKASDCQWTGTVRHDPVDHPLVVPGFTGHFYRGFPYTPVVDNVTLLKPDLLFFSGDQIYEGNGGYGIVREPADRAILCYLRKWYLFGWSWRELLRDTPAICLPDDHDVFHGNLWGEEGALSTSKDTSSTGGYVEPVRMVNVVHRTNCAHQPDPFDPTPVLRGMTVYYGEMVYGRVSFALLADRQFKSGPEKVKTDSRRADWVDGPNFDVKKIDKPGLKLLGERQLKFLETWVADWRGADMKVVLSQTVFANAATQHGSQGHFLQADLDSGGWPQSARDRAIRVMRKGYPLHYDGDQHLATLIQYGVDAPRDSNWSFCTPAVCSVYQRWWEPDRMGKPHTDRPALNLPNTGEYHDGLDNWIYVYAVANPQSTGQGAANRYQWADLRAGGFANVIVDTARRTYTCQCYHFLADLRHPKPGDQFTGWPLTIHQRDNYGRHVAGHLPEVSVDGVRNAVVQVTNQKTGELVYALRLTTNHVTPWVFEPGTYTVKLGDPDTGNWKTLTDQTLARSGEQSQ